MLKSAKNPRNLPELKRRVLPKLLACMTKQSLENMRNKALFGIDPLDAKGIRRRELPLYQCLILELQEAGYTESSNYLRDLLYDNSQLVEEDDIGIVVNLKEREDFLEDICSRLRHAERERERGDIKKECLEFLSLAQDYAEKGKGILWLAEKFFLASMAVASKFLLDGGRLRGVTKYFYAKFLLDKFPGAETDEAYHILTDVRDSCLGKTWPLYENSKDDPNVPNDLLFSATAVQLHRLLLSKARLIRQCDVAKAERLSRLAERRGQDANDLPKVAEAIIEVGICQLWMNNLNNARKTFERAFKISTQINNVEGLCTTRMHLAAVMRRLGNHEVAAQLLTEMGSLAMEYGLRRDLGLALHLLGELHLRRNHPELGTLHLTEAFSCFIGRMYTGGEDEVKPRVKLDAAGVTDSDDISTLGVIYSTVEKEIFREEAERSRLMTAISAGQEIMASYFELVKNAQVCTVATVKCIEWKLARHAWWVVRRHHDQIPCPCPVHHRTPLDVLWHTIETKKQEEIDRAKSDIKSVVKMSGGKYMSCEDIQKLRSDSENAEELDDVEENKEN